MENPLLKVRWEQDHLVVLDKRSGHEWTQTLLPAAGDPAETTLENADAEEFRLQARLPGIRRDGTRARAEFQVFVSLDANEPDLSVRFSPGVAGEWHEVDYPWLFTTDTSDPQLVLPHSEGVLLPLRHDRPGHVPLANDHNHIYGGYGCYCACLGLLTPPGDAGLLIAFDTPELAKFEMVDVARDGVTTSWPKLIWRANKYRFDRERRLTLTFSDAGGYVALAKHYRRHYRRWGWYKSLSEKAAENPTVQRLAGAPVFWVHGSAEDLLAIAQQMHADGIERAVLEIGQPLWWRPERFATELAAMERAIPEIAGLGYVVSRYDQYRDSFAPDEKAPEYIQARRDAYPDALVREEDGRPRSGWPPGFVINPQAAVGLAERQIPPEIPRFGFNGRFIDAAGTCQFWEGEDWNPQRPMDTYGARAAREQLLAFVDGQKLVVGTEGGIDCLLRHLHWLETPMSLVRWTAPSLPIPGTSREPLKPEYQLNLSVQHRVPFFSLVHHDEIVNTWRWEDGFSRLPELWQQKNLWSVLYGHVPMFYGDRDHYFRWRQEIAQTYRYVCTWTEQVAMAELVSHRFLGEDHQLQESVFSNGLGVVVNFAAAPQSLTDGQEIPANSYRTFRGEPRRYAAPPVGERRYQ